MDVRRVKKAGLPETLKAIQVKIAISNAFLTKDCMNKFIFFVLIQVCRFNYEDLHVIL